MSRNFLMGRKTTKTRRLQERRNLAMSAIRKRKKEKRRPRIRIVDWTMEPTIDFKLPDRRLSRDLLELLDSLGSEHPISQWLEVFRNPKAAFRRTFCRIRRAADGPLYNRQSDSFCAAKAIESLIASFQQYLNEFSLGLVVRKGMMSNQIHLQLRCQDGKVSRELRLLAALLAIAMSAGVKIGHRTPRERRFAAE
jgi:hypothetical protein